MVHHTPADAHPNNRMVCLLVHLADKYAWNHIFGITKGIEVSESLCSLAGLDSNIIMSAIDKVIAELNDNKYRIKKLKARNKELKAVLEEINSE